MTSAELDVLRSSSSGVSQRGLDLMASKPEEPHPSPAPSPRTRRPPKRPIEAAASVTASKRAKHVCELPAFSSWVSCDKCNKWRRVAQEPTTAKWYCSDNLDAERSTCSVPQEMSDAAIDIELNQLQAAASDAGGTTGVSEAA